MLKRAFDLCCALLCVLVLAPLGLGIGILIWWNDGSPVFYRQTRIGRNGRPFQIWKFRSMRNHPKAAGPLITVAGDDRITPVGRFLRNSKLDELPQLLNVIAGEMSLVGPRPEVPCYVEQYTDKQRQVLEVRPGITDPASLQYSGEERLLASAVDPGKYYLEVCMPAKLEINLRYTQDATLWTDLGVLVATITLVLSRSFAAAKKCLYDVWRGYFEPDSHDSGI